MAKATFGTVTEVLEKRIVEANGDMGPLKVLLRLNLKNTLGQEKEVWVEAPEVVADFYAPSNGLI